MHIRARKRFGQNFLIDSYIISQITEAIDPLPCDFIIEVGPGLGALTEQLLARSGKVLAIEIDRDLYQLLQEKYAQYQNFELRCQDALTVELATLSQQDLRVVGNLPYNISTPLIFHFLKSHALIKDMHFMLQKEVVERMGASPGSKDYGRLSVMVQYHCQVETLFHVNPEAFDPKPAVTSAVIRLLPYRELPHTCLNYPLFAQVVLMAFNQRRKTLRNSLKSLADSQLISQVVDSNNRAEQLSVKDFVALANLIHESISTPGL